MCLNACTPILSIDTICRVRSNICRTSFNVLLEIFMLNIITLLFALCYIQWMSSLLPTLQRSRISAQSGKKYQASISLKIIETAFSILSPECRGLRLNIQKKGFECTSKAASQNSCKGCTLSSMANGPKYMAAESAECWNRQSLMVKMA